MPNSARVPKTSAEGADEDHAARFRLVNKPAHHGKGVAQSHRFRSRLSKVRASRTANSDRDREPTVTSPTALSASTFTSSWPETPPGADPLPGQLDRWLASRGPDPVAVRRHFNPHRVLSGQGSDTPC